MEKDVEQYLKKRIELIGGLCWKFTSPGTSGVPDRIVIFKGQIIFVELKRPKGGVLSEMQKWRQRQIINCGAKVFNLKNKSEIDAFVKHLTGGGPSEVYPP